MPDSSSSESSWRNTDPSLLFDLFKPTKGCTVTEDDSEPEYTGSREALSQFRVLVRPSELELVKA